MRELEQLLNKPELSVATLLALVHAHKQHKTPGMPALLPPIILTLIDAYLDREAITEYESKVKELRKQADDVVSMHPTDYSHRSHHFDLISIHRCFSMRLIPCT